MRKKYSGTQGNKIYLVHQPNQTRCTSKIMEQEKGPDTLKNTFGSPCKISVIFVRF
jgi:hypothetical protein